MGNEQKVRAGWVDKAVRVAHIGHKVYRYYKEGDKMARDVAGALKHKHKRPRRSRDDQTRSKLKMLGQGDTSYSGGFVKTKKIKGVSRNQRISRRGFDFTMEVGGSVVGHNMVYIGHTTCPIGKLKQCAATALLKELMLQAGSDVSDVTGALQVVAGDSIVVRFGTDPISGIANCTILKL